MVDADHDYMTDSGNGQTFQMSRECGLVCGVSPPVRPFILAASGKEGHEGLLFRLGNKMDGQAFGSLLVGIDFSVRERRQRSSFGPLRQTVGGGGVEAMAGSN